MAARLAASRTTTPSTSGRAGRWPPPEARRGASAAPHRSGDLQLGRAGGDLLREVSVSTPFSNFACDACWSTSAGRTTVRAKSGVRARGRAGARPAGSAAGSASLASAFVSAARRDGRQRDAPAFDRDLQRFAAGARHVEDDRVRGVALGDVHRRRAGRRAAWARRRSGRTTRRTGGRRSGRTRASALRPASRCGREEGQT